MKDIFIMGVVVILMSFSVATAQEDIITRLSTHDKVVVLTFDACETKSPAFLDKRIVRFIVEQKIPCSIFVSGKFAERNRAALFDLARHEFIRLENHSWSHFQHMEKLRHDEFERDVLSNGQLLYEITGRRPVFFRFPAGNHDQRTVSAVKALGYRVVHWTFASGDPDKRLTPERLAQWVLSQTREGSILIFHINGRGHHTGEALPQIVKELRRKGYRFAALEEMLSHPSERLHSSHGEDLRK